MIINVECVDKMIEDICEYLDVVPEYLKECILDIANDSMDGKCFNLEKFMELLNELILEYNSEPIMNYICHLTRNIGKPELYE